MLNTKIKPSPSRIIFCIFNAIILGLIAFICFYPLWYVFVYTISDPQLLKTQMVIFWPAGFSLENILETIKIDGLANAFFISAARTIIGTSLTVFVCTLLGYAFSKPNFPARKILYRMLIITMYIYGGMVPTYLVYKKYGLLNNFLVYILPTMISAYYIILIKTYIEQLPQALEESAVLDGAGFMTILMRIIFPVSKPLVATICVYAAVGQWNAWFDNHLFAFGNKKITTLQYLLYQYLQQAEQLLKQMRNTHDVDIASLLSPFSIRMSITFITVIPIILVYPFFQRYIVKGIMLGSVKG